MLSSMAPRTIRARVHAGHLEPIEKLALLEGSEVTVTLDMPEEPPPTQQPVQFRSWNLGVRQPLTREDIHDDAG